jgi:Ca2+-binding EF-hand superfamily protein
MSVSNVSSSSTSAMLEEMRKKMQEALQNADANSDGALSKSEFTAFDKTMRANSSGGTEAAGNTQQGPSADDIFSMMDSDGDGSVTLNEAQNFKPPLPPEGMGALLQSQEENSTGASGTSDGTSISDLLSSLTGDSSSTSDKTNTLMSMLMQAMLGSYSNSNAMDATSLLSTGSVEA